VQASGLLYLERKPQENALLWQLLKLRLLDRLLKTWGTLSKLPRSVSNFDA
jgi:hypothetical protein